MARVGWTSSVGLAVGTAAVVAAAQFGFAYGLGIISWTPAARGGTPDDVWLASLAWTAFIAATSTIAGAVWADRRGSGKAGEPPRHVGADGAPVPPRSVTTAMWRTMLTFCAATGALLSFVLVLVPARGAVRAETASPEFIAAAYAVVGVVIGLLVAIVALAARVIMLNVLCSAVWLWLLAIAAAISGVAMHDGVQVAPLAVWPFGPSTYFHTTWSVAGVALMFGAALLIGAGMAWISSRRKESAVAIALSGAVGPLMVAAAYLLTAPRLVGVHANAQISAYLTAPYAVIAGLAGSVLVVVLASRAEGRQARQIADEAEAAKWSSAIAAPSQRAAKDAGSGEAKPATAKEDETAELGVGKDVPGRLPMPGATSEKASPKATEGGAVATATAAPADGMGAGRDRRPSPKGRKGRR